MLRLQRHLLGELLTAFVLILALITGIFLAGSLLQFLQKAPELSVFSVFRAMPLLLMLALPMTVPLSFLIACLLSYGRFSDDNEFLAMQMGGLSPWHAVAPGICAAAVLSFATLELHTDINPTMTSAKKEIVRNQVREEVARMRDPAVTSVKLQGMMEMSWDGREGEWFRDVFLTWTTVELNEASEKVKKTTRLRAERAMVQIAEGAPFRLVVTLDSPRMPTDAGPLTAKLIPVVITMPDESELLHATKGRDEMRAVELYYHMVRLESVIGPKVKSGGEWKSYHAYACEYWRRIALGLSPLSFALLAVPLGLVVRRGSRAAALLLALFIALPIYYPLLLWGDNLARAGDVSAAVALNMGNLLLSAAGLVLTLRLVTR